MFRSAEIEPGSAEMNVLLYEATFPRLTISKLLPTLSAGFRKISADRCDPRVCVYMYIFVWTNFCGTFVWTCMCADNVSETYVGVEPYIIHISFRINTCVYTKDKSDELHFLSTN